MRNRLIYCEECEKYYYSSYMMKHYTTNKHMSNT